MVIGSLRPMARKPKMRELSNNTPINGLDTVRHVACDFSYERHGDTPYIVPVALSHATGIAPTRLGNPTLTACVGDNALGFFCFNPPVSSEVI